MEAVNKADELPSDLRLRKGAKAESEGSTEDDADRSSTDESNLDEPLADNMYTWYPRLRAVGTILVLWAFAPVAAVLYLIAKLFGKPLRVGEGKTVLVTGGKMTKSLHFVRWFARAGYRVVLVETPKYWHVGSRWPRGRGEEGEGVVLCSGVIPGGFGLRLGSKDVDGEVRVPRAPFRPQDLQYLGQQAHFLRVGSFRTWFAHARVFPPHVQRRCAQFEREAPEGGGGWVQAEVRLEEPPVQRDPPFGLVHPSVQPQRPQRLFAQSHGRVRDHRDGAVAGATMARRPGVRSVRSSARRADPRLHHVQVLCVAAELRAL